MRYRAGYSISWANRCWNCHHSASPGAQQYQAQIEALKAVVSLVEVDETTFRLLLRSRPHPTIVTGKAGAYWFKRHIYLTSYDGFVFCLRTPHAVDFHEEAPGAFLVRSKQIRIPFL